MFKIYFLCQKLNDQISTEGEQPLVIDNDYEKAPRIVIGEDFKKTVKAGMSPLIV